MAFFICFTILVMTFICFTILSMELYKRWRKALLDNSTKIVYLRPDAWPMQVMNPGGDDCLTVPVEPTALSPAEIAGFTQMCSPLSTPSASTRPSSAWTSTAGSRPGSRAGSRATTPAGTLAGSRVSPSNTTAATTAAREGGGERGEIELSGSPQSPPGPSEQPGGRFQSVGAARRVQGVPGGGI